LSELAAPRSIGERAFPKIRRSGAKKCEYKIFWEAQIATRNCIEHMPLRHLEPAWVFLIERKDI
jgi:hypothetical protein